MPMPDDAKWNDGPYYSALHAGATAAIHRMKQAVGMHVMTAGDVVSVVEYITALESIVQGIAAMPDCHFMQIEAGDVQLARLVLGQNPASLPERVIIPDHDGEDETL